MHSGLVSDPIELRECLGGINLRALKARPQVVDGQALFIEPQHEGGSHAQDHRGHASALDSFRDRLDDG